MAYDGYDVLRISVADGVARATIDHPPVNLADLQMIAEVDRFGREVAADDDVRVVIVDSADPEFFVAHADVTLLQGLPTDDVERHETPSVFHGIVERFRTMPKATIAVVEGIARGGGSELALAFDMRFAALGKAVFAQPEILVGIIPGGGATQRLPRLVGRGRALEIVLGGGDVDAATAERWGYVNRALPPEELRPFVDTLAARIASFPPGVIARAKQAVDAAMPDPVPGLLVEDQLFRATMAEPEAARRMQALMDAGGQTREFELGGFPVDGLSP
jgi:enoyl-CoA hydratase/carnithine racemase